MLNYSQRRLLVLANRVGEHRRPTRLCNPSAFRTADVLGFGKQRLTLLEGAERYPINRHRLYASETPLEQEELYV